MYSRCRDRDHAPLRGQTAIIGLILLFGMVAAISIGMLVIAGDTTSGTEQQIETERAEQTFRQMSHEAETTSSVPDASREMSLNLERNAVQNNGSGRIIVSYDNNEVANETLGSIEYTTSDGSVIAYQGGGVWRGTGAEAVLVSRPSFSFDNESMTLPITQLDGDKSLHSGSVSMTSQSRESLMSERVTGQVNITIQSEYYGGWADYFENEVIGADVTVIDSEETVRVTVGEQTRTRSLADSALISYGNIHFFGDPTVEGKASATGPITFSYDGLDESIDDYPNQSIETETHDDEIETLIAEGESDDWRSACIEDEDRHWIYHCDYEGEETYYIDDMSPQRDDLKLNIDIGDGNVNLVVNDSIDLASSNDIRVFNANNGNSAHIYTNGDISLSGDTKICTFALSQEEYSGVTESNTACQGEDDIDGINANALQIYGTSDTDIDLGGGARVEGVVSAPTDGGQDNRGFGDSDIYGAIRAGSMDIGGSFNIVYDDDLADIEQPGEITNSESGSRRYLNVVRQETWIEND